MRQLAVGSEIVNEREALESKRLGRNRVET